MAFKKVAKTKKTTQKKGKKREFLKFEDVVGSSAYVEESQLWLKSGRYVNCAVNIPIDETSSLSDWARCIELVDVTVSVEENENGYPTLIISGGRPGTDKSEETEEADAEEEG